MRVAGYQRFVVCKRYCWNISKQIVTVTYLKKQPPELFCRKERSWKFYRKTLVLKSLLNKVADFKPESLQRRSLPTQGFSTEIGKIFNTYFLRTPVSSCNFIYNAQKRYSPTGTCRFDMNFTLIRRRPNFDKSPRHFHVLCRCNFADRNIHVVSTYLFWCNYEGWRIHVVSTYFLQCNFDGRKIHVVSMFFFRCNFDGRKIRVVSTYFFRCNFDGRKIHVVSTYFFRCNFDRRKIRVVSTYFFRCNFDGRKIMLFPRTFFDAVSMIKKSTLFSRTFFDVLSLVEISSVFLLTFFDAILMVEKSTLFARTFFDELLMGKVVN